MPIHVGVAVGLHQVWDGKYTLSSATRGTNKETHDPPKFVTLGLLIALIPYAVPSHVHQPVQDVLLLNLAISDNRWPAFEVGDMQAHPAQMRCPRFNVRLVWFPTDCFNQSTICAFHMVLKRENHLLGLDFRFAVRLIIE